MAELRQSVMGRATFAAEPSRRAPERARPRHVATRVALATARLLVVPFAALAAALAGAVFVVLLPICGIASLAEDFARASWRIARAMLPPRGRGALSHD
jgi:hypothetical protein